MSPLLHLVPAGIAALYPAEQAREEAAVRDVRKEPLLEAAE